MYKYLQINKVKVHLPFSKYGLTVELRGANVELCTKSGLKVIFDGDHRSEVSVPAKYRNKMHGLCGNWNGNKQDDMTDANGILHRTFSGVGNSWVVKGMDKQ